MAKEMSSVINNIIEEVKSRIITLITSKMDGDNDFLLEGIIQNIKDLI